MIHLSGVYKKYNGVTALAIPELEIQENRLIAIIGPNGSGKSTLLSCIANSIKPTSGNIFIDGIEVRRYDRIEFAKKVSIMNQSTDVNLNLTIEDLVSFGRYPYSKGNLTGEDKEIINEAIFNTDIYHIRNKYITQVSGGERQRALLSLLLAQQSKYILLDEPLNNLDMKSSAQLMNLLRNIVYDNGVTVLIVLHDINFAMNYADSLILMDKGQIAHYGSPESIRLNGIMSEIYGVPIEILLLNHSKYICVYY
jgi:iron complex transport system ATP-binding protein